MAKPCEHLEDLTVAMLQRCVGRGDTEDTCECGLISGSVKYDPEPLEPPAAGNLLICCSRPRQDLVIDI